MKKRKSIIIACVCECSYFLAMEIEMGFGGGTSRQTEGTSMSRPPGPVTCHLLRWLLSLRMPSLSLQITFCGQHTAHTYDFTYVKSARSHLAPFVDNFTPFPFVPRIFDCPHSHSMISPVPHLHSPPSVFSRAVS